MTEKPGHLPESLSQALNVIQDLRQNQCALEEANEELRRSNNRLEQFTYIVSHDLQEPLRSLTGCMQLLVMRYADKLDMQADEYIGHAVDACQRMRNLIDGLLTISRVDFSDDNDTTSTSVGGILSQVCANLSDSVEKSGAIIDYDSLPVVCAHPQMLIHLFQNLISNALKFDGGKAPVIHIKAHRDEDNWVFSVSDQGIGIDKDHFERIFQFFQRLHTSKEYAGTGLGLAICQKIVNQHGGKIWVESTLGIGTTFFFTLPAVSPVETMHTQDINHSRQNHEQRKQPHFNRR